MHRDIKPENIVITKDRKIEICDLEIIKEVEKKTQTREVGTEGYLAPELWSNAKYDESVDMWSLGITILQMYSKLDAKSLRYKEKSTLNDMKNENKSLYHICNLCLQENPRKRITSHGVLQYIDSLKKEKDELYLNPSTFYLYSDIKDNFQNSFILTRIYNFNKHCNFN
jgi:serine/threonine protein kinase